MQRLSQPHDEKQKRIGTRVAGTLLATLFLLLVGYVGSYYALVKPVELELYHDYGSMGAITVPHYAIGGLIADTIFSPIHKLDRQIRRDTWAPAACRSF